MYETLERQRGSRIICQGSADVQLETVLVGMTQRAPPASNLLRHCGGTLANRGNLEQQRALYPSYACEPSRGITTAHHSSHKNRLPCSSSVLAVLGFQDFKAFDGVDLLSFVKEKSASLRFPQKVSRFQMTAIYSPVRHVLLACEGCYSCTGVW